MAKPVMRVGIFGQPFTAKQLKIINYLWERIPIDHISKYPKTHLKFKKILADVHAYAIAVERDDDKNKTK